MSSFSSLDELAIDFEKFTIQLNEERFNQIAGLPYDKEKMEAVSNSLTELSSEFLNSYEEPRSFYLNAIGTTAQARKLPLTLKIHEERVTLISTNEFKIHNKPVNWGSWRQFNALASNSLDRKRIFDDFISKATDLAPLIMKRFEVSQEVYSLHESSPLEAYLEKEYLSYERLRDFLTILGDGAKKSFLQAADYYAPEILEKENFEYYDDFYVARGRIYSPINQYFVKKDPIKTIEKVLSNWGFGANFKRIKVDNEDREKKSPSAFCFGIMIPDDVRVAYKRVSPFSDFTSVFHEFGHAIHGTSGNIEDPYWIRYLIPMSVAETFSIFIETLMENPVFLKQELNLSEEIIKEIVDRRHFMNLYFLVFYSANSLLKLEFWKNKYTHEKTSERYQELTERFFWRMPGDYWLLHHVMPNYDLYSPSYMIASVRVKEWIDQMSREFGEEFWKNEQAGTVFRDLAATRGEFDLSIWDLDPKPYLEEQTSLSFLNS